MLRFGVLVVLCTLTNAWEEDCGISKYPDAGGLSSGQRIVGGQASRPNEFPWQVSMIPNPDWGIHYCGAFIVSVNYVMTAAHCTDGFALDEIYLVLGDWRRLTEDGTEMTYSISAVRQHENYNAMTLDNDISLMRTSSTIRLTENIVAVCPPGNEDFDGSTGVISGWGLTASDHTCCPNEMMWVQVPVMSNARCIEYYAGFGFSITSSHVCAGDVFSTDACNGDSGGALVVKRGDAFQAIGIVSWGIGCAEGYPTVYTRVSAYLDWIGTI